MKILGILTVALTIYACFFLSHPPKQSEAEAIYVPLADPVIIHVNAKPVRPKPMQQRAETKPEPNPLLEAMEANDICRTMKLLETTQSRYKHSIQALLTITSLSTPTQEAFKEDGPFFASFEKLDRKFTHTSSNFFWALRLGTLTQQGSPSSDAALVAAKKILLQLEKEDPANAAYPYFRLAVEQKLKATDAELLEIAKKIAQGSYFETHMDSIMKEITTAAWINPSVRAAISDSELYPLFLYPSLNTLQKLDFDGKSAIGDLMMQKGQRSSRGMQSMEYSEQEYSYGHVLKGDDKMPDIYQLSQEREDMAANPAYRLYPPIHATLNGPAKQCDPSILENWYYENRGKF